MKELSIEQKAKAYDKALERVKDFIEKQNPPAFDKDLIGTIFPELRESEDEKIRKALLELVHDTTGDELWVDYNVHKEDALAWLEKQGEQKPNPCENCGIATNNCQKFPCAIRDGEQKPAWSEEDETRLQACLDTLQVNSLMGKVDTVMTNWLKSLKGRVQPQPKQEWSEEDNQYLCGLIGLIEQSKAEIPITLKGKAADNCINWLKSLKQRIGG